MKLSEKLTERERLPILAAVDQCLNDQVRDVTELFTDVFENLQSANVRQSISSFHHTTNCPAWVPLTSSTVGKEIAVLKANIMVSQKK